MLTIQFGNKLTISELIPNANYCVRKLILKRTYSTFKIFINPNGFFLEYIRLSISEHHT